MICSNPSALPEINLDHERRVKRMQERAQCNPLRADGEPIDIDDIYGQAKVCIACHMIRSRRSPHPTAPPPVTQQRFTAGPFSIAAPSRPVASVISVTAA